MTQHARLIISFLLCLSLILEQTAFAQTIDLSGYFASNTPAQAALRGDKFRPLHLRYISYDNQANDFKILLDKGDYAKGLSPLAPSEAEGQGTIPEGKLEQETQELMKYFFIGLALPNDKFWVNLRPDSPDNILDPDLEKTDIGRIFLEADLQLKKDTSGMTSPQTPEGRQYWDKLYKRAGELFGTENITIPTITRPWIVPNEIIIRESPDSAYIYKATLKVMLEEDYLKSPSHKVTKSPNNQPLTSNYNFSDPRLKELNEYSTQLIKESIIPKLTQEINSARRYAPLRQVYYSLILAQWFKQKYGPGERDTGNGAEENPYLKLIDSGNLTSNLQPLTTNQPYSKESYFKQYQKSFKDGEYNLSEQVSAPQGQSIRRYVSGGINGIMPSDVPMVSASTPIVIKDKVTAIWGGGKRILAVGTIWLMSFVWLSQAGGHVLSPKISMGDMLEANVMEASPNSLGVIETPQTRETGNKGSNNEFAGNRKDIDFVLEKLKDPLMYGISIEGGYSNEEGKKDREKAKKAWPEIRQRIKRVEYLQRRIKFGPEPWRAHKVYERDYVWDVSEFPPTERNIKWLNRTLQSSENQLRDAYGKIKELHAGGKMKEWPPSGISESFMNPREIGEWMIWYYDKLSRDIELGVDLWVEFGEDMFKERKTSIKTVIITFSLLAAAALSLPVYFFIKDNIGRWSILSSIMAYYEWKLRLLLYPSWNPVLKERFLKEGFIEKMGRIILTAKNTMFDLIPSPLFLSYRVDMGEDDREAGRAVKSIKYYKGERISFKAHRLNAQKQKEAMRAAKIIISSFKYFSRDYRKLIKKIPRRIEFKFIDDADAPGGWCKARESEPLVINLAGLDFKRWSKDIRYVSKVFRHEIFHRLEDSGLFTVKEWKEIVTAAGFIGFLHKGRLVRLDEISPNEEEYSYITWHPGYSMWFWKDVAGNLNIIDYRFRLRGTDMETYAKELGVKILLPYLDEIPYEYASPHEYMATFAEVYFEKGANRKEILARYPGGRGIAGVVGDVLSYRGPGSMEYFKHKRAKIQGHQKFGSSSVQVPSASSAVEVMREKLMRHIKGAAERLKVLKREGGYDDILEMIDLKAIESALKKCVSQEDILNALHLYGDSDLLNERFAPIMDAMVKDGMVVIDRKRIFLVDEFSPLSFIFAFDPVQTRGRYVPLNENNRREGIVLLRADEATKYIDIVTAMVHEDLHASEGIDGGNGIHRYISEGFVTHLTIAKLSELFAGEESEVENLLLGEMSFEEKILLAAFDLSPKERWRSYFIKLHAPYKLELEFVTRLISMYGEGFMKEAYNTGDINRLRNKFGEKFGALSYFADKSAEVPDKIYFEAFAQLNNFIKRECSRQMVRIAEEDFSANDLVGLTGSFSKVVEMLRERLEEDFKKYFSAQEEFRRYLNALRRCLEELYKQDIFANPANKSKVEKTIADVFREIDDKRNNNATSPMVSDNAEPAGSAAENPEALTGKNAAADIKEVFGIPLHGASENDIKNIIDALGKLEPWELEMFKLFKSNVIIKDMEKGHNGKISQDGRDVYINHNVEVRSVLHEFGHVIENIIVRVWERRNELMKKLEAFEEEAKTKTISAEERYNIWRTKYFLEGPLPYLFIGEWYAINAKNNLEYGLKILPLWGAVRRKGFISWYASKGVFEDIAETFALLRNHPKEMNKLISQDRIVFQRVNLLQKYLSELKNFYYSSMGKRLLEICGGASFVSSPVVGNNELLSDDQTSNTKGGIDLSRINKSIRTESVSSPGSGGLNSPVDVDFDLNEELARLQNMLNAEIIPSSSRLDRYARAARVSSASSPESAESALSLVAETFRLQEERAVSAPAELKTLAVWLEQGG